MKIGDCRIGFIGFGHMAQTICQGIKRVKLVPASHILFVRRDARKMRENEQAFGITASSLKNIVAQSSLLILGMRPSQTEAVLKELSECDLQNKRILTLAAGIKIEMYQKYFGSRVEIARVMPNIASSVCEGMSVFSFADSASSEFKSLSRILFSALGEVMEVKEEWMDICCAIAGSGPGFVFRLIESMARAGEKEGLPYAEALKMSAQVFAGAARLILKGALPADLLIQIATPNGTTEAGLDMMAQMKVSQHLEMAVEAAARRSRQLGA